MECKLEHAERTDCVGKRALDVAVSDKENMPSREKLLDIWKAEFRKDSPKFYANAMSRLSSAQVDLFCNDETGALLWSLVDTSKQDGFWMESFICEEHALNFIERVGWTLNNTIEHKCP
jgi:hypothetical protein